MPSYRIKGKCIRPGCTRTAAVRGLCSPDIQAIYLAIRRNETTFERLEKEGKILKSTRTGIKVWIEKPGKKKGDVDAGQTEES